MTDEDKAVLTNRYGAIDRLIASLNEEIGKFLAKARREDPYKEEEFAVEGINPKAVKVLYAQLAYVFSSVVKDIRGRMLLTEEALKSSFGKHLKEAISKAAAQGSSCLNEKHGWERYGELILPRFMELARDQKEIPPRGMPEPSEN